MDTADPMRTAPRGLQKNAADFAGLGYFAMNGKREESA